MFAAGVLIGPAMCVDLSVVQEGPKYGPGTIRSLTSAPPKTPLRQAA